MNSSTELIVHRQVVLHFGAKVCEFMNHIERAVMDIYHWSVRNTLAHHVGLLLAVDQAEVTAGFILSAEICSSISEWATNAASSANSNSLMEPLWLLDLALSRKRLKISQLDLVWRQRPSF